MVQRLPYDPRDGQGGKMFRHDPSEPLQGGLMARPFEQAGQGMAFRYGGLLTYEKPITEFYGDIVIGSGSNASFIAGDGLPRNCVGARFINVVPGVSASINGFPFRTILNGDSLEGCEIRTIQIQTDALGSCILQVVGTGD